MKKLLAVLIALTLCLGTALYACAEQGEDYCESISVSETPEATLEKEAAEKEADESKLSGAQIGDLIRFIPAVLEVTSNKVTVYGYFLNLNSDCSVGKFKNFKMDLYQGGTLISSGNFGNLNEFTVSPLGLKTFTFTYNGKHRLNSGNYVCDDRIYSVCSYNFTYSK
jgi:hypothetical protein